MKPVRIGRNNSLRLIALLLVLGTPAKPQAQSQPAAPARDFGGLRSGSTRKLLLESGQKHRFQVAVESGQFFHIAVEKRGIDLVLSIVDPKGREVGTFNSPNGNFGFEHASVVAEQAGTYTVEVTPKTSLKLRGQYTISLRAVRAPTAEDKLRLQAQALFRAAETDRTGGEAGLHRAVEGYTQALALFEQLGEPYLKGLTLNRLGFTYEALRQPDKAMESYKQALEVRRTIHDRGGEAVTLTNIGAIYRDRGDKTKALEFHSQAFKIRRRMHDRAGQAGSLLMMAAVIGNPKKEDFYNQATTIFHDLGDRVREALCLMLNGELRYELGNMGKASESFSQALTIYRALGDRDGEAKMLNELEFVFSAQGESQKEMEVDNQALAIYRALGSRVDEARMLNNLGILYAQISQLDKALELYKQSLQIQRALGDRVGEAASLDSIGSVYNRQGEMPKALEFYNQSLALLHAAGENKGIARSLINIGTVYSGLSEPQKALEYFNQSLPIARAAGERLTEAQALGNIAHVYSDLGDKRKALEVYRQALQIKRDLGEQRGQAETLHNMASAYYSLGENQKALDAFNRTLAILRSAGDRTGESVALCNIANVYSAMGQNPKALEFCNQALAIQRAVGARPEEAYSLRSIGTFYSVMGEQQKALDLYNQALLIHRSVGDRGAEAGTLNSIGVVYSGLGDKAKALEIYQQAMVIFRAIGDRWNEARMQAGLGNTYWALGEKEKAMQSYQQAITLCRAGGDRFGEAELLDHMAGSYDELGQKEKALDLYGQALSLRRAVGDRPGEGRTLNNTGTVYDSLGQKQKALELYLQALAIIRSVGNPEEEAKAFNNMQVMFADSQPDLAIFFGKQAVNILQTVRRANRGLNDSLLRTYEKSIEVYYRNLASLLVERQRFAEAEEVLSLLKNRETSDFVQRDAIADRLRAATLSDAEKAAVARYDQVVGQVVEIGQKKAALLALSDERPLTDAEAAKSQEYDRDLADANTVVQRFLEEEGKSIAANAARPDRLEQLRRAPGIQDQLAKLGPDVVAIYTLVTRDKYIAMLVTPGAHKAYTTAIKESDLNSKVFEFRARLKSPASDPLPLAQELYHIVFPEGLRADLESIHAKTIMWSVDGALRYIPIAALHDGHDYLVQRFRNSLITPSSLGNLLDQPQARWQGLGYGVSKAKANFPALDSVPSELHGIFRTAGSQSDSNAAPLPGTVRLDEAFTQSAISKDLVQLNHRVVHIATHFDSKSSAEASILLLGDGTLWNLREISAGTRMFNGVELLTLSACSTAFTNNGEDGKEVDSLATLAQDNGAKSVIASLWSVSDEATAQLMQNMYRLRQQSPPMAKSEALRQAQEQMLSGNLRPGATAGPENRGQILKNAPPSPDNSTAKKDWRHPYYWAAFILIGNWK